MLFEENEILKNDFERRCMELEEDIQNLQQDFDEEREKFTKQYQSDELATEKQTKDKLNARKESFRVSRGQRSTSVE